MLKSLILLSLILNIAFAKDRFSEADKKKFLDEVKQGIAEHKVENKGKVDLQIIKPGLYAELEELLKQQKFTRDEMTTLKQRFEQFSKTKIPQNQVEASFYTFIQNELEEINKRALEKIKEGAVCNGWSCDDGLKCAPDPVQGSQGKLKGAGIECSENTECISNECVEEKTGSKKKICEDIYRCYRPLQLGQSCAVNPVCGVGICLPFNSRTSGIGECTKENNACKKNNDCCSNSCDAGICKSNYICKDCVGKGAKPVRGQKCCEGLYKNEKGVCAPDVPPSVIPQVKASPVKSFFIAVASFFISTADAGEVAKLQNDFNTTVARYSNADPGTVFQWAGGSYMIMPNDSIMYMSPTGKNVQITDKTNIIKLAKASSELRQTVIDSYGVDPLATSKDTNSKNSAEFEKLAKAEANRSTSNQASMSVDIAGYGKATYTYMTREGSGENEVIHPAYITSPTGKTYTPPENFYSSNEYMAMAGKKLNDDDYKFLNEEVDSANKVKTADSKTSDLEDDDDTFVNSGATNDGQTLAGGVMANMDKIKNGKFESKKGKVVDPAANVAQLKFDKKSDFATCDMRFKDDFYNAQKVEKTFDLEVAMLAFDFVITGDADNDYWTASSNAPDSSVYGRLKKVGLDHRKLRTETNKKIDGINERLTCMCLDVQGYKKITDAGKKKFFEEKCPEYAKVLDPATSIDELEGDASGLKGKRLLTAWTANLTNFHQTLSTDNQAIYAGMLAVSNWVASPDAKWTETDTRNYDLFKFNVKNPSGNIASLGAIVGALLAAGVIAIMGGFATTSILSAWGAAGIITMSAVTGAGGLWMIASLKGAWITMKPEISDSIVAPRTYSCGKKESCTEYTRTLIQPHNNVCNIHASANACLKTFVVVNEDKESRYIVDPWIPVGVHKTAIVRDQIDYAQELEQGFQRAKNAMIMKNPMAIGGGGKGGSYIAEAYMMMVFIDSDILGKYTPKSPSGADLKDIHFMSQDRVKLIKDAAKAFAVSEGFLEAGDTENLNAFANYAYEYHFVWPKKSNPEEISYPTEGLGTYLDFMAKKVSGNLTTGLAKAGIALSKLNEKYLKDYLNALVLYAEKPINQTDALKLDLIKKEIDKTKKDLDTLITFNSMLDNKGLDDQLKTLNSSFISQQSKLAGASGANFSGDQSNFLKAIGNLRTTRKEQLKSLATYNKAMADSGDKERTARVSKAATKFSDSFTKGNSSFGSGSALSTASSTDDAATENPAYAPHKNTGNNGNHGGADYGSGSGGLFGSGSGSGSSSKSGSSSDAGANGTSAVSDADTTKISDAIDARNKTGKDKYGNNEGNSLFQQITNAYIRNYDKVLTKKKDKDVIEDKQ